MAMKREMTPGWYDLDNRNSRWLNVFGRLKPGVSIEQAQASINSTYAGFKEIEYASFLNPPASLKERFLKHQITLAPGARGRSRALRDMERPLTVLMVMVGVVLLIACTNVANLLLARAANRQKEIAVRLALGASRLQIVRQLLIESGVLSLAGGIAGLLVSAWTASLLIQLLSRTANEAAISATPDARILGFTLLLSFATGLLFGIVPALQSTRPDVAPTLKNQVNHTTSSAGHVRLRKGLVTLQVVLSVVLLVGAGLFGRSLYNLKSADLGFRADRLLAFSVDPSLGGYQLPQWAGFAETLQQRIAALPGVEAASIASNTPFSGSTWAVDVQVEGYPARDNEDTTCTWYFVSPRYFATMGVPLVAGREFHDSDRKTSPQTVIVNEAFVKYFFKDQNAIGRKVVFGDAQSNPWMEIVGIVRDGKHRSLRDTEIPRVIYLPLQQSNMAFGLNVLLRSGNDPQKLGSLIRQEVRQMDANLPVFGMRTLDEQVNTALRAERMIALLSIAFGFLATLLACVGLYGVMTYTVTQRTREIGIRMALGANQASVLALVMREVALMAAIGIALAIPIGIALSRLVESQLFGVRPGDPATLLAAAAGIALLSALAGFAPARRATRIAPTTALRYE
jgi:predicted permease